MYYNDFGTWIRKQFPDFRVQKISIDAGFSCPNRDGRISSGGCTYCDNRTFNPSYCDRKKSITEQLEEGKAFFSRKYPDMKYLAYFQAYTNTYARVEQLRQMYEEALEVEDVVGIVIGTRPDCVSDELLDYLEELNRRTFVLVEYGIESANDETLKRINRGHDLPVAVVPWSVLMPGESLRAATSLSVCREKMRKKVCARLLSSLPCRLIFSRFIRCRLSGAPGWHRNMLSTPSMFTR